MPVQRVVDRAIDVAEAPARVLSLVAFVAIVWFIPIRVYTLPAPGPVKLEPYRLMVILLAAALVLGAIAGSRRIRACGLKGALLTLSASAVISLGVNYSSFTERLLGTEATKAATYLLTFPIVFVLVASGVRSRADVERCVKAIVVGGAVVAFCAIVETRTQYNVFNHLRTVLPFLQDTGERASEVRNGALRAEASAQHPIALGVALSLCLPLSLALMLSVRDTARRVIFSGCALILVIGMVATISRTAFLALAVMLLVGLMTERRRLTRLWPLTIVLLIAAHTVLPGGLGRLYNAFFPRGGITAEQSVRAGGVGSGRLADINPALKLVQSHAFFGTGDPLPPPPDLAENPVQTVDSAPPDPIIFDDQYLTTLVGHGVFGLGAVLWLVGAMVFPLDSRLTPRARLAAPAQCLHGGRRGLCRSDADLRRLRIRPVLDLLLRDRRARAAPRADQRAWREARDRLSRRRSRRAAAPALTVVRTRHAPDDGVDVGALAFDFVDVETPPRDAVVADAQDDDTTLLERRAVRLGARPVDLRRRRCRHRPPTGGPLRESRGCLRAAPTSWRAPGRSPGRSGRETAAARCGSPRGSRRASLPGRARSAQRSAGRARRAGRPPGEHTPGPRAAAIRRLRQTALTHSRA